MPTPLFEAPHCDDCRTEVADASELVTVPDGTDRPLRLCAACAAECEPMPVCPSCGSDKVRTDYIDLGIDAETGYHDEAAIFCCRACGVKGEAEELVYRPAILRPELVARRQPARETRESAARRQA
jgi:hypothetical protein